MGLKGSSASNARFENLAFGHLLIQDGSDSRRFMDT
jgi:hypothetical protein